jgi:ribosomal protein S18 acetylase RimI-like enzyme
MESVNKMDWSIRKASLSDVDTITELRIELLTLAGDVNEGNRSKVFSVNQSYFKEKLFNGGFSAWVAEVKGTVAAISGLVFFERPPQDKNVSGLEAYIMNMYTKPEYRGFGIARSLLEECITYFKSLGVGRIWLHSSQDGYQLYKKMVSTNDNGRARDERIASVLNAAFDEYGLISSQVGGTDSIMIEMDEANSEQELMEYTEKSKSKADLDPTI